MFKNEMNDDTCPMLFREAQALVLSTLISSIQKRKKGKNG